MEIPHFEVQKGLPLDAQIDKNIPIPAKINGMCKPSNPLMVGLNDLLRSMTITDSVYVPWDVIPAPTYGKMFEQPPQKWGSNRLSGMLRGWCKRNNLRRSFLCRTEGEGVRLWRIS